MMAMRGKRALALFVTCIMVLGMLPASVLAADSETEHIHGQAGQVGETYYTGVCDYTEGEMVQSETPDLCDEAVNAHEHTDACAAAEEGEAAVCTGELNVHEHTDACYSVTQTEGVWTCETGEPPVVEEPEAEPTQKPAEEPAETTPVGEQIALMSRETMTYTISDANAFMVTEWRGMIPEFSFEGVPGSTIDPKDLPAGPVLYQYHGNDWYYIYTGKIMGTNAHLGYTIDYLMLGDNGKVTANVKNAVLDKTDEISELRFFYEYAFAFPDLGSEGVTVMYSIDGGPLVAIDPSEPLIFSQAEVKKIGTVAFFVKARQGFYPADQFSETTGDQEGILNRIDDPKPGHELPASFDKLKQEALAEGFTHEFHYSEFKDGEFSDQGTRGYKLKGKADTNDYTITYHANAPKGTEAAGEVASQSGTWNTRFDIAKNGYTVSGYEFQGWNTAPDGKGENYVPGYTYTIMGRNLELYAQWKAVEREQKDAKFFIRQDGTVPMENGKTGYNSSLYLPQNAVKPTDPGYKNMVRGKIYGKAAWTDYKGVIVDGKINGVELSKAFASVSDEIAVAPTTEVIAAVEGVNFDPKTQAVAWYVVKTVPGDGWHVDGVIYDKDAKYILQYFPNAGEDTVNGLPGSKLYAENAQASVSYGSMAREGYTFLGWSEDPDATQATYTRNGEVQTIAMTGDKYLYAVWQKQSPAPADRTVSVLYYRETYHGSNAYDCVNYYEPDTLTISFGETKQAADYAGANYAGKKLDLNHYTYAPDAVGAKNNSSVTYDKAEMTDQQLTLKLYFRADETVKRAFTVSFYPQNTAVTKPLDQKVPEGDKAVDPQIPAEAGGRTFLGWYISGTDDKFDFSTPVTKDYVLQGRWETTKPAAYTVTVNFLEEGNTDHILAAPYVSAPIEDGQEFNVTSQIPYKLNKDGVDYTHYETQWVTKGTINGRNVTINSLYKADRAYAVEYYLETAHNSGSYALSSEYKNQGVQLWSNKVVTSAPYTIAISGYTYDETNVGNVKQVAYEDQVRTLKLYYKKDAPVDPGHYTVVYTDGTGQGGEAHQYTVTKTVGETYAVLADNSTTGFARTGHNFDGWKLREGSVVRGEGDKLYGDKGSTIYYDAQWTPGAYPITVTKTASGHSLPDNFTIAIADKAGQTVETLALAQATLNNGVYTWTTGALTFGEAYTFTEQNYAVSGYDLIASVRVLTGTDENGNVYQTTNGVTASLTLNDLVQTSGIAVAFTNSYSVINSGGGDGGYSYYRVTVNYLDRDGNVLDRAYQTDRIREGRSYDVTEQANKAIDGYRIDEIEGATTGTIRGNVTVNVRYVPDADNGGTVDIPDNDVPQGGTPDTTPGTTPGGNGQDEGTGGGTGVVIEDNDVPQGGQPDGLGDTGDQTDDKSGGSDETVIIDDDTPKGDLPQTGTLAQQADPTRTLGMLALTLSLAAAGLAVTIGRKKEDEA